MYQKRKLSLSDNPHFDREEQLSEQFLNISSYTLLDDIPEMLCEWWSSTKKDLHTFLVDEGLTQIIDDKTFENIVLGKYYFSNYFLLFIKEKLPYNVSIEKLYRHNKNFIKEHKEAEELRVNEELIVKWLKDFYAQKSTKRKQSIFEWQQTHKSKMAEARARYYQTHKEKEKEYKKQYRETHKEEIRAYKRGRREIENEQQRKRYHANIEKEREKRRLYIQNMSEEQKAKLAEHKAEYDRTHREQINARVRQFMRDESHRYARREKDRVRYRKKATEIQAKRKLQRLENLEVAKTKEREYGKVYRNKHREEINAKNRASYYENLEENRKRNAEKQKIFRAKKRFKTETGPMVMRLLDAILLSKCKH